MEAVGEFDTNLPKEFLEEELSFHLSLEKLFLAVAQGTHKGICGILQIIGYC